MKWLLLLVLLGLASAAAHPEATAPELREDVVAVGHEPPIPAPRTQWTGSITFRPGHDIEAVQYQICRVSQVCFAQPTFADRQNDTFTFDTAQYGDPPVAWGVGDGSDWHVGYKFILHHADGNLSKFPEGLSVQSDACRELGPFDCDATNYFVFTMPGTQAHRQAPVPVAAALVALAAARAARARSHLAVATRHDPASSADVAPRAAQPRENPLAGTDSRPGARAAEPRETLFCGSDARPCAGAGDAGAGGT